MEGVTLMGYSPAALGVAAVILLLSILQQSMGHQNFDNSWLFTVAERVLDGGAPYVDFIEANPPASFLIYMPAVALARFVGTTVEFMVCACVFAGGAGVIVFAGCVLRRANLLGAGEAGLWLVMTVFVMLFLPGIQFAQREHIAMLCLLPLLAVYAARAHGARCAMRDAIAAGLMAGITVAIKPHFALAALAPLTFVMVRRRSSKPILNAENWAVVCVVLAYGALLIWRFAAFFDMLPLLLDVYVPLKKSLRDVVLPLPFIISFALICGVFLAARKGRFSPLMGTPLLASLGFMGAYLMQAKGFPNHLAPCLLLPLLAACMLSIPALAAFASKGDDAPQWQAQRWVLFFGLLPMMLVGGYFCGVILQYSQWEESPGLRAAVQRLAPPQPRLIAASTLFYAGYPVVRQVGGHWVGRLNGLWITKTAQDMMESGIGDDAYRARLTAYIDRDARMLLDDVRSQKPDLILSDEYSSTMKAMRHPDIVLAFADYTPLEKVDDITIWGRKP